MCQICSVKNWPRTFSKMWREKVRLDQMPLVLGGEKIVALILYTSTHTLAWKENFFLVNGGVHLWIQVLKLPFVLETRISGSRIFVFWKLSLSLEGLVVADDPTLTLVDVYHICHHHWGVRNTVVKNIFQGGDHL